MSSDKLWIPLQMLSGLEECLIWVEDGGHPDGDEGLPAIRVGGRLASAVPKLIRPVELHLIMTANRYEWQMEKLGASIIQGMTASGVVPFAEARQACLRAWSLIHRMRVKATSMYAAVLGPNPFDDAAQAERRERLLEAAKGFRQELNGFRVEYGWLVAMAQGSVSGQVGEESEVGDEPILVNPSSSGVRYSWTNRKVFLAVPIGHNNALPGSAIGTHTTLAGLAPSTVRRSLAKLTKHGHIFKEGGLGYWREAETPPWVASASLK